MLHVMTVKDQHVKILLKLFTMEFSFYTSMTNEQQQTLHPLVPPPSPLTMTNKVNLTGDTVNILRNYCHINSSIVFRKGKVIRTIRNAENILAKYTSDESFPTDFAIYDLPQFLSGLALFDNPELDFSSENYVRINSGRQSVKYYYSDPEITLKSAPEKNVKFPGGDITFELNAEDLKKLYKAAAVYHLPDLNITTTGGKIELVLHDNDNDTSNTFKIGVQGTYTNQDLDLDIKMENVRVMERDYNVKVSSQLISEWTSSDDKLTYYIALEPK